MSQRKKVTPCTTQPNSDRLYDLAFQRAQSELMELLIHQILPQ